MGDINQRIFGLKHLRTGGRVLEIGSKNYGNTFSFRDWIRADEYVGLDIEKGCGVDFVHDLTKPLPESVGAFDTIICCSVLEHTPTPWLMAENISKATKPNGMLYVSVPWVQRYHAYPDDYFRISPRGVESLFPKFKWSNQCFSTTKEKEFIEFKSGADNKMKLMREDRKYLPYFFTHMTGVKNG